MNHMNKISQLELFSNTSERQNPASVRRRPFLHDITLTVENGCIVAVVVLMAFVLFFSLGVERGKILAKAVNVPAKKIAVAEEKKADIMGHSVNLNHRNTTIKEGVISSKQSFQPQKPQEVVEPQPKMNPILENFYTIQVASYKQKDQAEKEALKIKNNTGHETFVVVKGNYIIVCVGKFVRKDEAQLVSNRLRSKYSDNYIRRL